MNRFQLPFLFLILTVCGCPTVPKAGGSSPTPAGTAPTPPVVVTLASATNPLNNCTPYVRPKRALLLAGNYTGANDTTYTLRFTPEATTAIGIGKNSGEFYVMQANLRHELRLGESSGNFTASVYALDSSNNGVLKWGPKSPEQTGTFVSTELSFDPVFLYSETISGVRYATMIVAHRGKEIRLLLWNL